MNHSELDTLIAEVEQAEIALYIARTVVETLSEKVRKAHEALEAVRDAQTDRPLPRCQDCDDYLDEHGECPRGH